ncbi:MAG: transcriptional regulator [Polaromonas sp.]|nr:MAG: transcriptional regulator [Polaromonas sp.]
MMTTMMYLKQLDEFRRMPVETEWLEFKEAKGGFDNDAFGRYVSALSNEANLLGREAGWLILGVKDKIATATGTRPVMGSQFAAKPANLNELKLQVFNHTAPALGLDNPIEVAHSDCPPESRVLMWRIPAAARGMPVAWKGHHWGRAGESLVALPINKFDAIRAQSSLQDWSAVLATDDWSLLDPLAVEHSQALYKRRHAMHTQVLGTLQHQSVADWLHGLRLAKDGKLTRAALVLMGKPTAATVLGGPTPRLTWVLTDHTGTIQTHQHFDLPLVMAIDQLVAKLRIIEVSLLPPRQTAPLNLPNYDDWVIREALHNCIAHQDYAQGGRLRVTESPDSLTFFNLGSFLPGTVARVLGSRQPEQRYRNACLANAMVELDLMETLNSGVPKMFRLQRERFFPMPDFEFEHAPDSVSVRLYGKTLDEKYVHALMAATDLTLEDAILLDRVQKNQSLLPEQVKRLRAQKLVAGRGTRIFISAQVAVATGQEVSFVNHKGLDAKYYKARILDLLALNPQARSKINELLLPQLPESIKGDKRRGEFIKNLLQEMSRENQIENIGGATRSAKWQLKK